MCSDINNNNSFNQYNNNNRTESLEDNYLKEDNNLDDYQLESGDDGEFKISLSNEDRQGNLVGNNNLSNLKNNHSSHESPINVSEKSSSLNKSNLSDKTNGNHATSAEKLTSDKKSALGEKLTNDKKSALGEKLTSDKKPTSVEQLAGDKKLSTENGINGLSNIESNELNTKSKINNSSLNNIGSSSNNNLDISNDHVVSNTENTIAAAHNPYASEITRSMRIYNVYYKGTKVQFAFTNSSNNDSNNLFSVKVRNNQGDIFNDRS